MVEENPLYILDVEPTVAATSGGKVGNDENSGDTQMDFFLILGD